MAIGKEHLSLYPHNLLLAMVEGEIDNSERYIQEQEGLQEYLRDDGGIESSR